MTTYSTGISFAGVAFLMALSPGPNLIYLASRSICQGRSAGFASLAGVCMGMSLYMLATAAGLSAIFVAVPFAYDTVRLAGAAYLLWLAYKTITRERTGLNTSMLQVEPPAKLFRTGFFTCLLNPKLVITYGALLPQFVDASAGHVLAQTVTLGVLQVAAAAVAHSLVIIGASAAAKFLASRGSRVAIVQRYVLGTVLASLAVRLAFDRRNAA